MKKTKILLTVWLLSIFLSSNAYVTRMDKEEMKPPYRITEREVGNMMGAGCKHMDMNQEFKEEISKIYEVINFDKLDDTTKSNIEKLFSETISTMMKKMSEGKMPSVEEHIDIINKLLGSLKQILPSSVDTTSLDSIRNKIVEKIKKCMSKMPVMKFDKEIRYAMPNMDVKSTMTRDSELDNYKSNIKINEKLKVKIDKLLSTKTNDEKTKIINKINNKIDKILNSGRNISDKVRQTLLEMRDYLNYLLSEIEDNTIIDDIFKEIQ